MCASRTPKARRQKGQFQGQRAQGATYLWVVDQQWARHGAVARAGEQRRRLRVLVQQRGALGGGEGGLVGGAKLPQGAGLGCTEGGFQLG